MKLGMLFLLMAALGSAAPFAGTMLTFDGLQPGEQVLSYYDGGFGGLGSGPGPLDGVTFTSGLAANATVIAFGQSALVTANSTTMNLDTAWSGVISFYFLGSGSFSLFSGTNATGVGLGSYVLSSPTELPFAASAGSIRSVVFTSQPAGTLRLDSISFGVVVVPEPSSVMFIGVAGLLAAISVRVAPQRRRAWLSLDDN